MILGVHASVARGLAAALPEAQSLGVTAMQILPYQRHHPPSADELARFREARRRTSVSRLFVHSRFVPSPASADAERRRRSVELLSRELSIAAALEAEAFVLHAGAYSLGDQPRNAGLRLAGAIQESVLASGFAAPVLLENVPGGGRRMGGGLEELAELSEFLRRASVPCGLCLDTAHAWAAGYDVASAEGMDDFLSRAESLTGAGAIRLFHVNDTLAQRGSRLENHWHWGQGLLSAGKGAAALLARSGYADSVAILETPKGPGADAANLAYLRALVQNIQRP